MIGEDGSRVSTDWVITSTEVDIMGLKVGLILNASGLELGESVLAGVRGVVTGGIAEEVGVGVGVGDPLGLSLGLSLEVGRSLGLVEVLPPVTSAPADLVGTGSTLEVAPSDWLRSEAVTVQHKATRTSGSAVKAPIAAPKYFCRF